MSFEIEKQLQHFVHKLKTIDTDDKISKCLDKILIKLYNIDIETTKSVSELIFIRSFIMLFLSIILHQKFQKYIVIDHSDVSLNSDKKENIIKLFKKYQVNRYKSIFDISIQIIELIPYELVHKIIQLGLKLSNDQQVLSNNFSATTCQKIVGNKCFRRGFSAYYTSIPNSYLLAYLGLFAQKDENKNLENIKICDFACGSGILLNAAYSALVDLFKIKNKISWQESIDVFYRKIIEENIWGFDSIKFPLYVTLLNFIFQNDIQDFNNFNLYSVFFGLSIENTVRLGSLDFLHKGKEHRCINIAQELSIISKQHLTSIDIPEFDLIIMNPPFTRATGMGKKNENSGLFGFITEDRIKKKLVHTYREKRNIVNKKLFAYGKKYLENFMINSFNRINSTGAGSLYLFLAFQYLNKNGKICFILPKSLLNGSSWFLIRTFLLENFHINYIVISYDKRNGYNFSESTRISELLLVATKKELFNELSSMVTNFVMMLKKPETSFDATELAKKILNDSEHISENSNVIQYPIKYNSLLTSINNWGKFVAFPNLKLLEFVELLSKGILFNKTIQITSLDKIADLGIDRHRFSDSFFVSSEKLLNSIPTIYGGKENIRKKIFVSSNAYIISKSKKAEKMLKEKSSILLVPDRIRMNTIRVVSLITEFPTLSNIFYAVKLKIPCNMDEYKALCAWFNSSFGLLLILSNRQETDGTWISLKLAQWRLQSVLNITVLDKTKIKKLSKLVDDYSIITFDRISDQFNNINKIRLKYDLQFLRALDIDVSPQELISLYRLISNSFANWFNTTKSC